jgi:hypothetical protein
MAMKRGLLLIGFIVWANACGSPTNASPDPVPFPGNIKYVRTRPIAGTTTQPVMFNYSIPIPEPNHMRSNQRFLFMKAVDETTFVNEYPINDYTYVGLDNTISISDPAVSACNVASDIYLNDTRVQRVSTDGHCEAARVSVSKDGKVH